jgi:hypothetical protein
MLIRSYQPGDEHAQARIYNAAACSLPGFKPATAEEISRRYGAADSDPATRHYAIAGGEVAGYAAFHSNGRASYPWCLPDASELRGALLDTMLAEMRKRSLPEAWVAYRADWLPILAFLYTHAFTEKRVMINYVAELPQLPGDDRLPASGAIAPLKREDLSSLVALAPGLFAGTDAPALESYFWSNEFYNFPDSLFGLRDARSSELRGAYVLVADDRFADPVKIDASMPCFRLGAFGTERERHKRVNGLFSCVFADQVEGELMLSTAAWAQMSRAGLTHLTAQVPSDATALCAFYDLFFQRQGSFPILARRLTN